MPDLETLPHARIFQLIPILLQLQESHNSDKPSACTIIWSPGMSSEYACFVSFLAVVINQVQAQHKGFEVANVNGTYKLFDLPKLYHYPGSNDFVYSSYKIACPSSIDLAVPETFRMNYPDALKDTTGKCKPTPGFKNTLPWHRTVPSDTPISKTSPSSRQNHPRRI